jgi:hypothetical protein
MGGINQQFARVYPGLIAKTSVKMGCLVAPASFPKRKRELRLGLDKGVGSAGG